MERTELFEAGATSVFSESEEVAIQLSEAAASQFGKSIDVDLARLCVQEADVQESFNETDENSDELADLDLLSMDSGFTRQEVIRLYRIFQSADLDGNGEIDAMEAREMIARASEVPMSSEDFDRYMATLDADGSGRVTFEEFLSCYAAEPSTQWGWSTMR